MVEVIVNATVECKDGYQAIRKQHLAKLSSQARSCTWIAYASIMKDLITSQVF